MADIEDEAKDSPRRCRVAGQRELLDLQRHAHAQTLDPARTRKTAGERAEVERDSAAIPGEVQGGGGQAMARALAL